MSFPYTGNDCDGNSVTIFTVDSVFSYIQSAYLDSFLTTPFTGYFQYEGVVYFYLSGNASVSACPPTPPPTPTPPPPTPTPPPPTPTPPPPPTPTPTPTPPPPMTSPDLLKSEIHSNFETGTATWQSYRDNVTGLFISNSGTNQSDYRDHLIREFNRKINNLNQPTGLFIRPYDDGFRFTVDSIA